jgi:pilus assembly protein CpaD
MVKNVYPNDYRERHPITLSEGNQSVEVFLGRNRGGLLPNQRADVLAFAQAWRHEGTSGIIIDVPQGGPTARAAADSLREINSILLAAGVPRRAIYLRRYTPNTSLASIKINYSKLVAHAGPCGLWPHDLGPVADSAYNENQPYWNLGCASQRNLAAMIDNPADLVQPRGEAPAYEARRSVALDKYRQGQDPSGIYNGYDKSKISDLGK